MKQLQGKDLIAMGVRICTRCIYDETVPKITFDEEGVCNYCKMIDTIDAQYHAGTPDADAKFTEIVERIKKAGKGKKYDCVIGVSGGTDSSYMVVKAIQMGLRPLAVHYDNTWNTSIATENIRKVLGPLKVDLFTHVVNNREMDDIFKSFLKANVPDLDSPTDLALAEVLYRAASKYGVKYILEGHSYMTEGVSPLGYNYIDGGYIKTVQKMYGNYKIKTYPLMDFLSFMKWVVLKRIMKIRPLWYIPYNKADARKYLEDNFGWKYYGGHHLENRMTAFWLNYYNPAKFGVDQRNNSLAALVRSGLMSREEALKEYAEPPHIEEGLIEYFKKRMELSDAEFDDIISGPRKSFRDYKTYKPLFEKLRPLFFILAKLHLVPMSFYIKYTSKEEM